MSRHKSTASHSNDIRYFRAWIAAQSPLLVAVIAGPTFVTSHPIAATLVTAIWLAATGFITRLWREIEEDAITSAARILKAIPRTSLNLSRRLWAAAAVELVRGRFTRKYCRLLDIRYGLFNDRGLGLIQANRIDLDSVYVDLRASTDPRLSKPASNIISGGPPDSGSFWDHLRRLENNIVMVIVGVPGSGKSTLLQHILLTFAKNKQWTKRMLPRLPFFVPLHTVASIIGSRTDEGKAPLPTLCAVIAAALSKSAEELESIPRSWLERKITHGRCIFLFDGLDEVADPISRQRVSAWMDSQASHPDFDRHLFVVTARPFGYKEAPLARSRTLEVQPFSHSDSIRFIRQWYLSNEIACHGNRRNAAVKSRAEAGASDLLSRLSVSSQLRDFMVNPLLLTMVCMVHRYQGALPASRVDLYQEICQVLLERWRQSRGLTDDIRATQKLDALRPLAALLMQERRRDFSLDDATVCAVLTPILTLIPLFSGKSPTDALRTFFLGLQASSGLVLETSSRGSGTWSFAHQTFQEFLCAEYWHLDAAAVPSDFCPLIGDAWWREALLVYCLGARDASPVGDAALRLVNSASDGRAKSRSNADLIVEEGLTFIFALLDEKPNLNPIVRHEMERKFHEALRSQTVTIFLPAARALLRKMTERNYQPLDDKRELSPCIPQAVYQAFLLADKTSRCHTPFNRNVLWFSTDPKDVCLGITLSGAVHFCGWLDRTFPQWRHRLPIFGEIDNCPGIGDSNLSLVTLQADRQPSLGEMIRQVGLQQIVAILIGDLAFADDLSLTRRRSFGTGPRLAKEYTLAMAMHLSEAVAHAFDFMGYYRDSTSFSDSTLEWHRERASKLQDDRIQHKSHGTPERPIRFILEREPSWQTSDGFADLCLSGSIQHALNEWCRYYFPKEIKSVNWRNIFEFRQGFVRVAKIVISILRDSGPELLTKEMDHLDNWLRATYDDGSSKKLRLDALRVIRERRPKDAQSSDEQDERAFDAS